VGDSSYGSKFSENLVLSEIFRTVKNFPEIPKYQLQPGFPIPL